MINIICTACPKGCHLTVCLGENDNLDISGYECKRGITYARDEVLNPSRVVTSTVRISGAIHRRCPVKTNAPIPKDLMMDAMRLLDEVELVAPVKIGQVVVGDVCGTGVPFVATRSMCGM